ncbi:hypothetical protein AC057_17820 [Acinetobacter genomosp. 33YU]|uniref:hypothetical protein n=1 Tax=Acinetobacter genomosp. 33YU TaxID=1675530 RepID=UPI00097F8293|nr:hypothetical protein [Acinetobacter genomosp. 33YU]ONN51056.1 hypothetical protein AC057_17820 [Acinetobacter genomosp. 33YU]
MQPRIFDKMNQTLIKTWSCNKLSDRSKGKLKYQLWQDNDDQSFGIALSENESSGGFSTELIKVDRIVSSLQKLYQTAKPFHAVALKELFIGKSVNNASFLGAALVDQGVIRLHPQTARLLEVNDEYELWPLSVDDVVQQSSSPSESSNEIKPASGKRGPKPKNQQSTQDDGSDFSANKEDKNAVHQEPI